MSAKQDVHLEMSGSRLFSSWLAEQKSSLAFTTYQASKLFLIGLDENGNLAIRERTFDRCMGMGVGHRQFWMSSLYQLWKFQDFTDADEQGSDYDALYVPTVGYTTGDVDIHDIHTCSDGKPIFVVTRFNCIATLADHGSFRPIWRPPFIDRIAAEDRCHLNGMAVQNDKPKYATCVGRSNTLEGWRDQRRDGGLLIDIESEEVVVGGLSMPHSPRIYGGKVWLLQTGTGEFGYVDLDAGQFIPLCFLPGFARGLTFCGDHAIIGLSRPRENRTFDGLVLNERLEKEGLQSKCAICIVNLKTGDVEHRLNIEGVVQELYDVALLKDVVQPKFLGFRSDQIRFAVRPEIHDTA